jgi:acid phosphatase (class A)
MRRLVPAITAAFTVVAAPLALGQGARASGYLAGHEPDTVAAVPPAPRPGDARDVMDMAVYRATRALKTRAPDRWALAVHDADAGQAAIFADFDCALGVHLSPQDAPALAALVRRVAADVGPAFSRPKDLYRRPRPYVREAGDICVPHSKELDEGFDYPSGHATYAWTVGLILAQAAPDRAGLVLERARAIGESRVVCGVHTLSAITEARTAAMTLMSALDADPVFRADLKRASGQLAALRAAAGAGPKAQACSAERALVAQRLW